MKKKFLVLTLIAIFGLSAIACSPKKKSNKEFNPSVEAEVSDKNTQETVEEKQNTDNKKNVKTKSEETIDTNRQPAEIRNPQGSTEVINNESSTEDGKYVFTMPDFTEKKIEDVMSELSGYDIDITEISHQSSDKPKGLVISQSVKAGEEVERGISLSLVVSKNTEVIKVPNVIGKTVSEAKDILKKSGLKAETSLADEDEVYYQNYKADDTVASGTIISLK